MLIWLDKEMTWLAPHDGSPGRPAVFSDAALGVWLTIRVLFRPPPGQMTGMAASRLKMAYLDWAVPDQTAPVPMADRSRTAASAWEGRVSPLRAGRPAPGRRGVVTADGACDTRRCRTAIIDRQAAAIIPVRKDG